MGLSATYLTVDGEILTETVNGVSRDFLTDPLGAVVGLIDHHESIVAKREYWPYGETKVESGDWIDTSFGYIGSLGYYDDGGGSSYVRFRYLDRSVGAWQTLDPIWPSQKAFIYVNSSPLVNQDPSGLRCEALVLLLPPPLPWPPTCDKRWNDVVVSTCRACNEDSACQSKCDLFAGMYYEACAVAGKKPFRSPMPGEHWNIRPGKGAVPIYRPRRPHIGLDLPYTGPVYQVPDYPSNTFYGTPWPCIDNSKSGNEGIFDLAGCIRCAHAYGAVDNGCIIAFNSQYAGGMPQDNINGPSGYVGGF